MARGLQATSNRDAGVRIVRAFETVPAAGEVYEITQDMVPPGLYNVAVAVSSNVTGTTTTLRFTPYKDEARSAIVDNGDDYIILRGSSTPVGANTVALGAGAHGYWYNLIPNGNGTAVPVGIAAVALLYGMGVTVSKGTAVTGETFVVDLMFTRIK